ncbi:hypothetical protein TWF703_000936 [Orbilia oligospora]|uniref:Uncharacterized protein n=1 Tax=Orbilia oligospora TaxID=2813651 RepID=A0A7C8NRT1_ORBOL|nr:hypothetical protein TWF703_000936 [Orbilia oligospora]
MDKVVPVYAPPRHTEAASVPDDRYVFEFPIIQCCNQQGFTQPNRCNRRGLSGVVDQLTGLVPAFQGK